MTLLLPACVGSEESSAGALVFPAAESVLTLRRLEPAARLGRVAFSPAAQGFHTLRFGLQACRCGAAQAARAQSRSSSSSC